MAEPDNGGGGGSSSSRHIAYPEVEYDAATAPAPAVAAAATSTDGDGNGAGGGDGAVYRDTNAVPRTPQGTTLHMDLREGDVASRVLTVGDPARARRIASALDGVDFHKVSSRGFVTYTGRFEGVAVSVVAIGMGLPMMDFFVRETRQIVDGPMLIVRYGTCGLLQPCVPAGRVVVASVGSVLVMRNPDAFLPADTPKHATPTLCHEPFLIFHPQPADEALSQTLVHALKAGLGEEGAVVEGLNASACSFYSSQGRRDPWFDDDNSGLLDRLRGKRLPTFVFVHFSFVGETESSLIVLILRSLDPGLYPATLSMEMETYQLFALANASRAPRTIRAAAASIGVANRPTGEVCSEATLDRLELEGGTSILRALVATPLVAPGAAAT